MLRLELPRGYFNLAVLNNLYWSSGSWPPPWNPEKSPKSLGNSLGSLRRVSEKFRVGFWQNGFFADFYFWAAGFFRGFCRRIFSRFCGKKCPEKSSRKIPGKILQNLYNKNPRHISAEGPGQKSVERVFSDCSRDFWRLLGFRDFFGISKGPRDLCKGQAGSQPEEFHTI